MSMVDVQMMSPSRKRPAPDDDISSLSTPAKIPKSSPVPTASTPATSPKQTAVNTPAARSVTMSALSSPAGTLSPPPPLDFLSVSTTTSTTTTKSPIKKKKRTKEEIEADKKAKEVEREAKKAELEEKKRQKEAELEEKKRQKEAELEEKRRKKEEEELLKNEEKKKKAEEREEKKREREMKTQVKELEKQRKVEEQEKKAKAQSRLSNFFAKPPVSKSPSKKPTSEYEGFFLPFNLASHASLPEGYSNKFDPCDSEVDWENGPSVEELLKTCKPTPPQIQAPAETIPVEEIMDIFQGTAESYAHFSDNERQQKAIAHLKGVTWRYIHFHEDVRPPYWGTWTKRLTAEQKRRLARNPNYKLDVFDYDYDSEAEWEEPEEGEELNSDDEEEEEDGDDDMEDFLDDEEGALAAKRGLFSTELVPVNSGLQWEDTKGKLYKKADEETPDFSQFTMEFLLCENVTTIDPFSTEYWAPKETNTKSSAKVKPSNGLAATARPALLDKTKQINGVASTPTAPNGLKPARLVPAEDIEQFKQAIDGQDLTKIAMVEHLKKLFPQLPKDAIVNSLAQVAEREGKKASAKWRLKLV